jgi:hypothetical protein
MAKNITILPDIKKVGELTPLEKKIASEITRFTLQQKWFYKSFDTFAVELGTTEKTVKKTYHKLKKLEWMETEKSELDKRFYKYRMTQKFFNFISNISEKKDENWAVLQSPNSNRIVTDKSPNSNRIVTDFEESTPLKPNEINTQTPVNNSPKVLNNEGIKVLRVEEKGEKKEEEKEEKLQPTFSIKKVKTLEDEIKEYLENKILILAECPQLRNIVEAIEAKAKENYKEYIDFVYSKKLNDGVKLFDQRAWNIWYFNDFYAQKKVVQTSQANSMPSANVAYAWQLEMIAEYNEKLKNNQI